MSRGFEEDENGNWVPFDDELPPPDPRKNCPWKCKPGDPKCLCQQSEMAH